jgi:hypothetical protein
MLATARPVRAMARYRDDIARTERAVDGLRLLAIYSHVGLHI